VRQGGGFNIVHPSIGDNGTKNNKSKSCAKEKSSHRRTNKSSMSKEDRNKYHTRNGKFNEFSAQDSALEGIDLV